MKFYWRGKVILLKYISYLPTKNLQKLNPKIFNLSLSILPHPHRNWKPTLTWLVFLNESGIPNFYAKFVSSSNISPLLVMLCKRGMSDNKYVWNYSLFLAEISAMFLQACHNRARLWHHACLRALDLLTLVPFFKSR